MPLTNPLTDAANYLYDEYRQGRFPMSETADDPVMIVTPHERALLPINDLHISQSLRKTLRRGSFEIRVDTAFDAVIAACAEATPDRPETWISPDIRAIFGEFHRLGKAHSVECWQDGQLVGGLYGLEVGGVFCGESMFSRVTDASKVALVHLCTRLSAARFSLLDAQFHNPHLEQFGLEIIPQPSYVERLMTLRDQICDFRLTTKDTSPDVLLEAYLKQRLL